MSTELEQIFRQRTLPCRSQRKRRSRPSQRGELEAGQWLLGPLASFFALSGTSMPLGTHHCLRPHAMEDVSVADHFVSVLQTYYQDNQLKHKSPSDISWIGSLQIFFLFAGGLFGGPLFDRYGAVVSLSLSFVFGLACDALGKRETDMVLVHKGFVARGNHPRICRYDD